jgi:signal transduction histidine kinase
MSRISYILFLLMIIGFAVSLVLYKESEENRRKFNARIYTVSHVLLYLERCEKYKDQLLTTLHDQKHDQLSWRAFSQQDKLSLDSALLFLQRTMLYDEQRRRLDTMRNLFDQQIAAVESIDRQPEIIKDDLTLCIDRAKVFAQHRRDEQRHVFIEYDVRVRMWSNLVLASSVTLFVIGLVSTFTESSARRRMKRLHEAILADASIGIMVFDLVELASAHQAQVIFFNQGAICTAENGEDIWVNIAPHIGKNGIDMMIRSVFQSGKSVSVEMEHEEKGRRYSLVITVAKVSSRHVALYYQDITSIKSYERQLKQKVEELETVNRDLEQFAHATSHDLREPFRKIQVMADLVRHDPETPKLDRFIEIILRASAKGTQLVQQILNYSKVRFDKSELTSVDLTAVLNEIVEDYELIIEEKKAMVSIGELPVIQANRIQMVQLFGNLIGNSLKFSAPDRSPLIRVEHSEVPYNGNGAASKFLVVKVIDNGIGFEQTYHQQIFTAFQRLNNYDDFPGFGLGLSLCKKIVLNHGGKIEASSTPGAGSEFIIYLPATS